MSGLENAATGPTVSCIWAMAPDGLIGREGNLPWRLSADLRRFRSLTMGHTIVMGRKTWESLDGPLPGRRSIVLSRQSGYAADGAEVAGSFEEALEMARDSDEVFAIGGAAIYEIAISYASRVHVTLVQADLEGDVYLPSNVLDGWKLVGENSHKPDDRNQYPYSFRTYERVAETVNES